MVSKLLFAVQEVCQTAIEEKASPEIIGQLLEHFYEIYEGIGVHKSPALYGAFPTDPYSHTPFGKGAQQPGMTGQVKEDILSRFGELGVYVRDGKIHFQPTFLRKEEFLTQKKSVDYISISDENQEEELSINSLFFTHCKVPVIYKIAAKEGVELLYKDQSTKFSDGLILTVEDSQQIFIRNGEILRVKVYLLAENLR